jgi:hypothetical protein
MANLPLGTLATGTVDGAVKVGVIVGHSGDDNILAYLFARVNGTQIVHTHERVVTDATAV